MEKTDTKETDEPISAEEQQAGQPETDVELNEEQQDQASDTVMPTPDELTLLKEKAAKCEEHYDRLLRMTAEFDNFKKRTARDRMEAIKYANEALIEQLIPTLDHFDMAIAATQNKDSLSLESIKTGVSMVYNQFKNILADHGLEEMDASGKMFDPSIHEAVSQKECTDVPEGQVVQQLRKGFRLKEKLIRPATVVVAKKPADPADGDAGDHHEASNQEGTSK